MIDLEWKTVSEFPQREWHPTAIARGMDIKWEPTPKCPICGEEMDWLDTVLSPELYRLYICHNDKCDGKNLIYNDRKGQEHIEAGDPSGHYLSPTRQERRRVGE